MHSAYLHSEQAVEINLDGLFGEAGMDPGGDLWFVPTEMFFRVWRTPVGEHLRARGFRLENDGRALGASQDCVVHIPQSLMEELF